MRRPTPSTPAPSRPKRVTFTAREPLPTPDATAAPDQLGYAQKEVARLTASLGVAERKAAKLQQMYVKEKKENAALRRFHSSAAVTVD